MDKNTPVMIVTSGDGDLDTLDLDKPSTQNKLPLKLPEPNNSVIIPAKSNSFLGADLQPFNGMPPPKLNVVKKSRILVNPGKSMVEWMKFQQDQSTGSDIKLRKIGLDEIALHNKSGDVWMALNDRVYDVTEYVNYHPGGVEEIMKGAGQDATIMFNQIHRWVNVESILRKNLLGFFVRHSTLDLMNKLKVQTDSVDNINKVSNQLVPKTKFSEDKDSLYFEVDSDVDNEMTEECWTVGILNRERFLLKVILKPPELFMAHLKLLKALRDDQIALSFENNFKRLCVKLKKPQQEDWKGIGSPLEENNKILDSRGALEDMYPAKLIRKEKLTHNVFIFTFEVAKSAVIGVPVGFHVKIRLNYVCRKYTPVPLSFLEPPEDSPSTASQKLHFIIKLYQDGNLTKQLDKLPLNQPTIEVGCSGGSFDPDGFFQRVHTLILLAAGTGITPFIKIIQYLLRKRSQSSSSVNKILLIFFNETEKDIILKNEWDQLVIKEPNWFKFYPVISKVREVDANWTGLRGRISSEVLEKCFKDSEESKEGVNKAIICGSYGFNDACKQALRQQTVTKVIDPSGIFIFTG